MTRSARWLALIVCLSAVTTAATSDPWIRIQSSHFELFTTAGDRSGRDLLRHFEQVRSFFLQAFGAKASDARPVRVVMFRTEKEFQPYRPSEAATAFFHAGADHDYIVMVNTDTEHYQTATHEYTHLLINQVNGVVPLWLNEGLADLYSTVEQTGDHVVVGEAPPGRAQSLRIDRWVPLETILSAHSESPLYNDKSLAGMYYAESWALVHMLNLEPFYRQHLDTLLDALNTSDAPEAFRKAYGKTIAGVQADLQAYINSQYLHELAISVTLPDTGSPEIETGATMAARIALAELLADSDGKIAQAATAYSQLAHDFPKKWEAAAACGRFAWRERHNQEAVAHFGRAVEFGTTDPRVFVDYARALTITLHPDQAVAALRKAIALEPTFRDAHYELGLLLVRNSSWQEGIAQLKLARPLKQQWAAHYFYNAGYAEFRLGDLVAARNFVEQGRAYTRIPEEVAALNQLSGALGPPVVDGVLSQIDCRGRAADLHVRVGDQPHTFLIPDLTTAKDLECGTQKDVPVRIEFQSMPLGNEGADGIVKSLLLR